VTGFKIKVVCLKNNKCPNWEHSLRFDTFSTRFANHLIIPVLTLRDLGPSADPARPWGEASAVKVLGPTTAPHTQHHTSITPKKAEVIMKEVESMMPGILPHLSRKIPNSACR